MNPQSSTSTDALKLPLLRVSLGRMWIAHTLLNLLALLREIG
jgi:hypothetical protein